MKTDIFSPSCKTHPPPCNKLLGEGLPSPSQCCSGGNLMGLGRQQISSLAFSKEDGLFSHPVHHVCNLYSKLVLRFPFLPPLPYRFPSPLSLIDFPASLRTENRGERKGRRACTECFLWKDIS